MAYTVRGVRSEKTSFRSHQCMRIAPDPQNTSCHTLGLPRRETGQDIKGRQDISRNLSSLTQMPHHSDGYFLCRLHSDGYFNLRGSKDLDSSHITPSLPNAKFSNHPAQGWGGQLVVVPPNSTDDY